MTQYPGWDSNPQAPGFKPGRSAVGVPGRLLAEAVGLEPTSGPRPPPAFKTGPSTGRMASVRLEPEFRGLDSNQRPPRSERGVTTDSNCPGVREGGFEPPPPDSKSGSLPVSRFPRAPRGSRTRLSDLASPRLTARPGTHQRLLRERDRGVEPRSPGWKPGVVPLDQSRGLQAEGEGVEPSRLIARPGSGRVPSPIGLSFRVLSSGGRNRTCVPPVNSRVLVPARAPPESKHQTVGMAGFEPAISCSQGRRIGQAFLHPESCRSPNKCPAGVEPARPPWRGGRLPLHHGHLRRPRIVKDR